MSVDAAARHMLCSRWSTAARIRDLAKSGDAQGQSAMSEQAKDKLRTSALRAIYDDVVRVPRTEARTSERSSALSEARAQEPLDLVVRRVGREGQAAMPAGELVALVEAIYAVYRVHVPAVALDPLRAAAARWTSSQPSFRLLPPSA